MNVIIVGAGGPGGLRSALEELGIIVEERKTIEDLTLAEALLKAEEPLFDDEICYDPRPQSLKIKKLPAVKAAAFNRKTVRATSPVRRNKPGGRRK